MKCKKFALEVTGRKLKKKKEIQTFATEMTTFLKKRIQRQHFAIHKAMDKNEKQLSVS